MSAGQQRVPDRETDGPELLHRRILLFRRRLLRGRPRRRHRQEPEDFKVFLPKIYVCHKKKESRLPHE